MGGNESNIYENLNTINLKEQFYIFMHLFLKEDHLDFS